MKVIRVINGEKKYMEYPRKDMQPIEGLNDNVRFYVVIESEKPDYDSNTHTLVRIETFSDDKNEEYPHLYNMYVTYNVTQLSNSAIINNLNNSLGEHLDNNYPVWKRVKHLKELSEGTTEEREEYIKSLQNWEQQCRDLRDNMENELLENGTLPSFEWPECPIEIFNYVDNK